MIKKGNKVKVTLVKNPDSKKYEGQIGIVIDTYKETFGKKKVLKYIVKMDQNNVNQGTVLADKVEVIEQ